MDFPDTIDLPKQFSNHEVENGGHGTDSNNAYNTSSKRGSAKQSHIRQHINGSSGGTRSSSNGTEYVTSLKGNDDDDAQDALLSPKKTFSFESTDAGGAESTTSEYWLDEQTLRTQLWDAYRLARVILGRRITQFSLDSATILHAIRVVAEMKLELIELNKKVEFYEEGSSTNVGVASNPTSATGTAGTLSSSNKGLDGTTAALEPQITELQDQLKYQSSKYDELDRAHQKFVAETKQQLQDIFIQLHALPKSSVSSKQAADIQVTLQKLIQTVAVATTKPQVDQLRDELHQSKQETRQVERQKGQIQKELESHQHLSQHTLETTKVKYEQQLAVCKDQIAIYNEQVTNQEEELVYSQRKLDEIVNSSSSTGAASAAASKKMKSSQRRSIKIKSFGNSSRSLSSPTAAATKAARAHQDKELQGMLIKLETIVPKLVKSVKGHFKRNKKNRLEDVDEEKQREGKQNDAESLTMNIAEIAGESSKSAPTRPGVDDDENDIGLAGSKRETTSSTSDPNTTGDDHEDLGRLDGEQKDGDDADDGKFEIGPKELGKTLELQEQVSTLLQQVAVHQTTRRVTELKVEIAETLVEQKEEDEELEHLKLQLEMLEAETKHMSRQQFQEELRFWQAMRQKYERQLERMKQEASRKAEIKDLNRKCDDLSMLAVEMSEFEIVTQDEEDGLKPMMQLIEARQEGCVNGTNRLKEQLREVEGDFHDFCHAVEQTLVEVQSASWLYPDVSNDDEAKKEPDEGDSDPFVEILDNPSVEGRAEFANLQTKIQHANKLIQLEHTLKQREQELASTQSELAQSNLRITELEKQTTGKLRISEWKQGDMSDDSVC